MSQRLIRAYHESGHALAARRYRREIRELALGLSSEALHEQPFAPGGTEEEIEQSLLVLLSGPAAEKYVPAQPAPGSHGTDPWLTLDEAEALMRAADKEEQLAEQAAAAISDDELVGYATARLGGERVAAARELAEEFAAWSAAVGDLAKVAHALLQRGCLTGDDLERLLAPAA